MSLRLEFDVRGYELAAALECEADVFYETYGNTSTEFAREYGPYEQSSRFIAVLDSSGFALAACRIIVPGSDGLKTLHDLSRPPWRVDGARSARAAGIDPAKTWDLATLAVRKKQSSAGRCAAALYHGIVAGCRANRIDWVVMIMDERARRLASSIGISTSALPGTAPGEYLGSPTSTPLFGHVPTMSDVQRRRNSEAFRLVVQGIGLDGISVPPADAWRLRPRVPAAVSGGALL
jgi:hypothetical protein